MAARRRPLIGLFLLFFAGCPAPQSTVMGDVPLGEYDVQASKTSDNCVMGGAVYERDLAFRARLSGDSTTGKVYMVVSVAPAYTEQPAVRGEVEGGDLLFVGQNPTQLRSCSCSPMVSERFAFTPLLSLDGGAGDGGVTDAGAGDGGSPDAGDGGPTFPGLPASEAIVGLSGTLDYTVASAVGCEALDADAGTGCVLPCEIHYLLEGTPVAGTP